MYICVWNKTGKDKVNFETFFFQIFLWKLGKDIILLTPSYLPSFFSLQLLTHRSFGLTLCNKREFLQNYSSAWNFLIQKQSFEFNIPVVS